MVWPVYMVFDGLNEIAISGNYPKIRLFGVPELSAASPADELAGIGLAWSVASPPVVTSFYASAVCWIYARLIHIALGGRPIGIINTSWSGTVIEFWMPRQALTDCGLTKFDLKFLSLLFVKDYF
jgi:sialate O-acetylesterase